MLYMLDTDICSYIIKRPSLSLLSVLQQKVEKGHSICISVITYMELRWGVARARADRKYNRLIDEFSDRLDFIANWTTQQADQFARLQAALFSKGRPIGHNDTMIAAHAVSLEAVLVTNNHKHFSWVEGLISENWLKSR